MYLDTEDGRRELQRVMDKIISKKIVDNLNSLLASHGISNIELSRRIGRSHNAVNKIINQGSNLRTATLLRVVYAANEIVTEKDENRSFISLNDLVNEDVKLTIGIASQISLVGSTDLITSNKRFFRSLKVYKSIIGGTSKEFKQHYNFLLNTEGGNTE